MDANSIHNVAKELDPALGKLGIECDSGIAVSF